MKACSTSGIFIVLLISGAHALAGSPLIEEQTFSGSCTQFVRHVERSGIRDADGRTYPGRGAVSEFLYAPRISNLVVFPGEAPKEGFGCGSSNIVYVDREQCLRECAPKLDAANPVRCTPVSRQVCYVARIGKRPAFFGVESKTFWLDWRPSHSISEECVAEKRAWENAILERERLYLQMHVTPVVQKYNRVWNNGSPHLYQACGASEDDAKQRLLDVIRTDLKTKTEAMKAEAEARIDEFDREDDESPQLFGCDVCAADKASKAR